MSSRNRMIRLLGLTSIGLGLFDWLSAETLADRTGMRDGGTFRLAGAREIASGVGIALFPASPAPLVSRLIGDAMDVVILSAVAARPGNDRRNAALIGVGMVVAISVIDAIAITAQRRQAAAAG